VIILRIENSNDYYVDIKGDYERSCFGMSLEDLVQFTQPISELPLPAANPEFYYQLLQQQQSQSSTNNNNNTFFQSPESSSAAAGNVKLSIPKELWRIVDALWAGEALKEKDLFNSPGDAQEMNQIRYALDHGSEFDFSMSPHSLADTLIHFLNSMPKPLLPMELYPQTEIDPMNMRVTSRKFLEDLPTINYNVFVYLLSFLREVLVEEAYNR
jgi:phosphatidylinositol-bisphosphatase